MDMGNNHRNQNDGQPDANICVSSEKNVSDEMSTDELFPADLGWVLRKHGVTEVVSALNEIQKARVVEILYLMDSKATRWAYEHLTGQGMKTLVKRLARTEPTDDADVDEYWRKQKPYFDFRRIGVREASVQIAIVKGLVQLSDKALEDVIKHGQANLWPLACFGWSGVHTFEWADKISDEMAKNLYDRMAYEHVWTSHTLLDVIAVLTAWDETLEGRSHLWVYWQILYTCVNSGLAFRLAVRDCTDEHKLQEYRVMALAALPNLEAVKDFERCCDMKSTADDALAWFVERLKTHPVNYEVTQPLWFWEQAQSIGLKYGTQLIRPTYG